jgi:hypothetical protein
MTFLYGFASDKTRLRGPIVLFALSLALIFWITFQQTSTSSNRSLKYGILVLTQGLSQSFHVSTTPASARSVLILAPKCYLVIFELQNTTRESNRYGDV